MHVIVSSPPIILLITFAAKEQVYRKWKPLQKMEACSLLVNWSNNGCETSNLQDMIKIGTPDSPLEDFVGHVT